MARTRKTDRLIHGKRFYILTLREVSKKDYDLWEEGEALNGDENMSQSATHLWEGGFETDQAWSDRPPRESTLKSSVEGLDVLNGLGQMW